MKFIPITVSTPLILPIIHRKKVVTRRLLKDYYQRPGTAIYAAGRGWRFCQHSGPGGYIEGGVELPYEVGDILWVKEEHYAFGYWVCAPKEKGRMGWKFLETTSHYPVRYSDNAPCDILTGQKPSMGWYKRLARFMFAVDARLFLRVENISVERLQDITENQAEDEGVERGIYREGPNILKGEFHLELNHHATYRDGFRYTIQTLHGRDVWDKNPWVVAVSFDLIDKPKNFPHQ